MIEGLPHKFKALSSKSNTALKKIDRKNSKDLVRAIFPDQYGWRAHTNKKKNMDGGLQGRLACYCIREIKANIH